MMNPGMLDKAAVEMEFTAKNCNLKITKSPMMSERK